MTTTLTQDIETNRCPLPPSLANWFDEPALIRLALDAVHETESAATTVAGRPGEAAAGTEFRELLTLVTYCYATAVYGSRQIEFEATRDEGIDYLCGRRELDGNAIRHFRRTHREHIQHALTRLLSRAWERRAASGWSLVSPEANEAHLLASLNLKTEIEPTERFALDAAQRIRAAIQADSMALDD